MNWHDHASFVESDISKIVFSVKLTVGLKLDDVFHIDRFMTASQKAAEEEAKRELDSRKDCVVADPSLITIKKRKKGPPESDGAAPRISAPAEKREA